MPVSEVRRFYGGSTVFLTGATGSLGKLLLEKLLRSCADIARIYLLIRLKKGRDPKDRFKDIFGIPAFGPLKEQRPDFLDKVEFVAGDCALPQLGLNPADLHMLVQNVDVVLHCAATVRFDQSLRVAACINVRAVIDLVAMAKQMPRLKALVHVSTAYSHCYRTDIDETFYEEPVTGRELLALVHHLTDTELTNVTPGLLGKWPNTYVFTKAIAEDVIRRETGQLPVAIVRPSIVVGASREPLPGWIDNIYGPTGVSIGIALGLIRTFYSNANKNIDLVPADHVVNIIIAASANIGRETNDIAMTIQNNVAIYNQVSCVESPLTWGYYKDEMLQNGSEVGSVHVVYCAMVYYMTNWKLFLLMHFVLHLIPAYIADGISICLGKKAQCVDGYKRFMVLQRQLKFFTNRQWRFYNRNTRLLFDSLSVEDKRIFPFSMKNFDWSKFLKGYCNGVRVYILKDPMETVPQALRKLKVLFVVHNTLKVVSIYCLYCGVKWVCALIF